VGPRRRLTFTNQANEPVHAACGRAWTKYLWSPAPLVALAAPRRGEVRKWRATENGGLGRAVFLRVSGSGGAPQPGSNKVFR